MELLKLPSFCELVDIQLLVITVGIVVGDEELPDSTTSPISNEKDAVIGSIKVGCPPATAL